MKESSDNGENISKEENNDDILVKQNIIKEKILDLHYDKNKFFLFCMKLKPENGDNLKNWTIEELEKAIKDFIDEQNKYYINTENKMNKNIEENFQNKKNLRTYEIPCPKLDKTILNDKLITSTMKNPKIIEAGFFSNNYILYDIETPIAQNNIWIVQRRYSDFIWLRDILRKVFPLELTPPLPAKKIGSRRFEMDFVSKRMNNLNIFLNKVLKNETFKTSDALVCFLSIQDRERFEDKKKEINSYPYDFSIQGLKTIDGKILISDDDYVNEKYFSNISNYFYLQNEIYDKLNEDLSSFNKSIISSVEYLSGIQKDFELLHLLNSKVSMKKEILKTFEIFGVFFKNWKRVFYNQGDIIKKYVKNFFKSINEEGNSFCEITKFRDNLKENFGNIYKKLNDKKEKLWEQNDINKWEISENFSGIDRLLLMRDKNYAFSKMCTSETYNVNNLQLLLRYANKKSLDLLKSIFVNYQTLFPDNVKTFSDKFFLTLNDEINIWTNASSNFIPKGSL